MARFSSHKQHFKRLAAGCAALLLIFGLTLQLHKSASGAELGPRSFKLSNAEISSTPDALLSFDITTPGTLGSVYVEFCSNDAIPGDTCVPSAGLDASGAVLADQTGPGDFTIDAARSSTNSVLLTRTPGNVAPGNLTFHFTGIVNPSSPGSYFIRLQTYPTPDATGQDTDDAGIAYAILNSAVAINATVPPFLIFCTGVTISGFNCANAEGDYIDFGEFGFNLRANVAPAGGRDPTGPGTGTALAGYNTANSYRFVDGEMIASSPAPDDMREYTASYIVNRPLGQAAGVYVSTLTYICLATF
jgi:hypothetical protein